MTATRKMPDTGDAAMLVALRAEHQHIAAIMGLLSQQLNAVERGDLVDPHVLYEIMDYMVMWPDRFHHPREDLIYDHAAELDRDAAADLRTLQREHEQMARLGRELLQAIEGWRSGATPGTDVVRRGRDYIQRSHEHMNVEEDEVFPLL
ncbi:MAG: hemerythrin domain-containing protein, partial [Chromatocurvus sp.]